MRYLCYCVCSSHPYNDTLHRREKSRAGYRFGFICSPAQLHCLSKATFSLTQADQQINSLSHPALTRVIENVWCGVWCLCVGLEVCGVGVENDTPRRRTRETGILLPNNQCPHRTSHAPKDVLSLRICDKEMEYSLAVKQLWRPVQQRHRPRGGNSLKGLLTYCAPQTDHPALTRVIETVWRGVTAPRLFRVMPHRSNCFT